MKKRYGDTKTALRLSAKAESIYSDTQPLSIFEEETDDGEYRYTVTGFLQGEDLTEDEVNALLESLDTGLDIEVSEEAQRIVDNGLFDAAVELMDDEIREEIHSEIGGECTDAEFLTVYMEQHLEKYGIDFIV